jgi:hypothetical protein
VCKTVTKLLAVYQSSIIRKWILYKFDNLNHLYMGHFTIALSNNQQGDVRWGTITKKSSFLGLFRKNRLDNEVTKGYIVTIEPASKDQKEYRLLKTKEGEWTSEDDGGFRVTPDDQISMAIKKAIDNYESQH